MYVHLRRHRDSRRLSALPFGVIHDVPAVHAVGAPIDQDVAGIEPILWSFGQEVGSTSTIDAFDDLFDLSMTARRHDSSTSDVGWVDV